MSATPLLAGSGVRATVLSVPRAWPHHFRLSKKGKKALKNVKKAKVSVELQVVDGVGYTSALSEDTLLR